jgi:hypothetical protein
MMGNFLNQPRSKPGARSKTQLPYQTSKEQREFVLCSRDPNQEQKEQLRAGGNGFAAVLNAD